MTSPSTPINVVYRAPNSDPEFDQVWDLRYKILRGPWSQPSGSERDPGDAIHSHLAAIDETGTVLATARLDDLGGGLAQIRFVAVDSSCQGKGIGSGLMKAIEALAWEKGFEAITLHARENAVVFYTNLGYSFLSPSYYLWDQIQHYEMRKWKVSQTNSTDGKTQTQLLYSLLHQSLKATSIDATKALVNIFIDDIISKDKSLNQSIKTTPTTDGKTFPASQ